MDETLAGARARFFKAIEGKGTHCPCCDRKGKINGQHLDTSKARALLWFRSRYVKDGPVWIHPATQGPRWMVDKNMFSTMKHWGLIEACPKDPENTKAKTSGLWRITDRGMAFAEGRSTESKTAWIYNDTVQSFSAAEVRITDCTEGFDYGEMMNATFNDAVKKPRKG